MFSDDLGQESESKIRHKKRVHEETSYTPNSKSNSSNSIPNGFEMS